MALFCRIVEFARTILLQGWHGKCARFHNDRTETGRRHGCVSTVSKTGRADLFRPGRRVFGRCYYKGNRTAVGNANTADNSSPAGPFESGNHTSFTRRAERVAGNVPNNRATAASGGNFSIKHSETATRGSVFPDASISPVSSANCRTDHAAPTTVACTRHAG